MSVSIVVPIHNELENLPLLYQQLCDVAPQLPGPVEFVLVDDGSYDGSDRILRDLAESDPQVKVITFRRNYGQTAAMQAGMQLASGDYVVTLDGDLQNDPDDIPMMIAKLEEGFDLVHGWRKDRQDAWMSRKLPSKIANWIIARTTRFPIHDLGCTLKAMRREIAQELDLVGEMHRFIPILAHQRGARCVEVVTKHHPRRFGTTKYGIGRTSRVVLDLLTVKFLLDYFASPMKLFGRFAIACGFVAMLSCFATITMKMVGGIDMTGNPLLLLSALATMASLQLFSIGLLGEVSVRTYYGSQGKQHFAIREILNYQPETNNGAGVSRHGDLGYPLPFPADRFSPPIGSIAGTVRPAASVAAGSPDSDQPAVARGA
jgi:hypothetical protein